jgi:hypothetical protein
LSFLQKFCDRVDAIKPDLIMAVKIKSSSILAILRTVLDREEKGVEENRAAKMRKYSTRYQSECIRDNEAKVKVLHPRSMKTLSL